MKRGMVKGVCVQRGCVKGVCVSRVCMCPGCVCVQGDECPGCVVDTPNSEADTPWTQRQTSPSTQRPKQASSDIPSLHEILQKYA